MENHLTEQELIEYQFKLISDIQRGKISGHLQGCLECREKLERLRRKFSVLDLLRDEVRVSEELISRVIKQAEGEPHVKRGAKYLAPPFRRGFPTVWIISVAAVLMAGLLLLVAHLNRQQMPVRDLITTPALLPQKREVASAKISEEKSLMAQELAESPGAIKTYAYTASPAVAAKPQDATIGEAPFAPASAIELVVLPRRDSVQITIYNSADLTLVRERRNLTLKRGWNWLQFMWANTLIDPTSLSLEPQAQAEKIDVQQMVFPPRLRELGRWLIRSEVNGQVPFEITYFTSGLSWRAFYMGTLSQDEKSMQLQGYVRVTNNSGEDYENAQTRLIVGQVHILDQIAELARRQYPYGSPVPVPRGAPLDSKNRLSAYGFGGGTVFHGVDALKPREIRKEGLSEYFLYTIEGNETINNQWGKRLLSFEANDINIESLYKYDEQRWGDQTIRFMKFTNDEEHHLGQTPIPNGDVKIYARADEPGYLSYVGGTGIKYIPVNEEVELNLGPARLVKIEPTLMNFRTENYMFGSNGNITGWDEIRTWKIEITNTRTLPVQIEITRGFDTAYWSLQCEIPYEKYDVTRARFNLNLEPASKCEFEYTVTTYHGTRETGSKTAG